MQVVDPRAGGSGSSNNFDVRNAGKRKKSRKHSKAQAGRVGHLEQIEVGITNGNFTGLNNSGQFGSGANPSTKRYESEMGNSREERTNRYSSKVSRDDVGPKSSILIDVNESVEYKNKQIELGSINTIEK